METFWAWTSNSIKVLFFFIKAWAVFSFLSIKFNIFICACNERERGMNENRAHWTQQVRRWKKGAIKAKEKSFLGHKWHEKLSFHLHLLFVTRWEVMKIETYIGISTSMYALLFAIECILWVRFLFIQYCNNPVVLPCWLLFLLNKI